MVRVYLPVSSMGMPRKIAFLGMDDLGGFVADDDLAVEPLEKLGFSASNISWRTNAKWAEFEAVIIRSTWDYPPNLEAFLERLADIDSQTLLMNPLDLVRWNADKRYLTELERRNVSTVPTRWPESISSEEPLAMALTEFDCDELVVKPVVGASAVDTFRWRRGSSVDEIKESFGTRPAMVQPFLRSIVEKGEASAFFFNGILSHAVRKIPKPGDFRVQEEYGGDIVASSLSEQEFRLAAKAMAALPTVPLYARVDMVGLPDGNLALIELELIEPSLYLRTDREAPSRFADAIAVRLVRPGLA